MLSKHSSFPWLQVPWTSCDVTAIPKLQIWCTCDKSVKGYSVITYHKSSSIHLTCRMEFRVIRVVIYLWDPLGLFNCHSIKTNDLHFCFKLCNSFSTFLYTWRLLFMLALFAILALCNGIPLVYGKSPRSTHEGPVMRVDFLAVSLSELLVELLVIWDVKLLMRRCCSYI